MRARGAGPEHRTFSELVLGRCPWLYYKVVGTWARHQLCGVLFNVGGTEAALPLVNGPVEASQLPGIRWVGTDPLGRVGVGWQRVRAEAPTAPVLFDVGRSGPDPAEILLTRVQPVLVSNESWRDNRAARFVDTGVPLLWRGPLARLSHQSGNQVIWGSRNWNHEGKGADGAGVSDLWESKRVSCRMVGLRIA